MYFLYLFGFWISRRAPLRTAYAVAEAAAHVFYIFAKKGKKILRENLHVVLGEDTKKKVLDAHVLKVFKNFSKYLVDFFRLSESTKEDILRLVKTKNMHHIDKCLSEGKGAILLSVHLGNWELGGATVAARGYKTNAIVLKHDDRRINNIFTKQRSIGNVKNIPIGGQLRRCFKALKSNELLAIAGDRDYTRTGKYVKFFGRKTTLPRGAAALSLKTGAPIIVCSLVREKDDTFTFLFEEPIKFNATGDLEKDVGALMAKYVTFFEKHIEERPDQWYMFKKAWKQGPIIQ